MHRVGRSAHVPRLILPLRPRSGSRLIQEQISENNIMLCLCDNRIIVLSGRKPIVALLELITRTRQTTNEIDIRCGRITAQDFKKPAQRTSANNDGGGLQWLLLKRPTTRVNQGKRRRA